MNTNRKLMVVGLGEGLWDMLPGGKQLGGASANFAYQRVLRKFLQPALKKEEASEISGWAIFTDELDFQE